MPEKGVGDGEGDDPKSQGLDYAPRIKLYAEISSPALQAWGLERENSLRGARRGATDPHFLGRNWGSSSPSGKNISRRENTSQRGSSFDLETGG